MEFAYDIHATYEENYRRGPRFEGTAPEIPESPEKSFLGLTVGSRIGIAAGLLLNSKWILGYAGRGFDLLTYKTVRSRHRPCYPLPNWVFVDDGGQAEGPVRSTEPDFSDPSHVSSAVCFGMPSMAPEVWREDVARAKAGLQEGQRLIVSVVASPGEGWSAEQVAEDFAVCAGWAAEAGADIIEANFSCPNVCTSEGSIFLDAELSGVIAEALRKALGAHPFLIKVGYFPEESNLRDFLQAVGGKAGGITIVNGISRPVLHSDGRPVFGESFVKAGVLGRSIHEPSVRNVRAAKRMIADEGLDLSIAAVGGVSTVGDFGDFFEAGADAVMLGSSPMYLPNLAAEARRAHPEW